MNMTNKLILPVESRMQGDLHVRFGGRLWETYHRKVARRPSPSLLLYIVKEISYICFCQHNMLFYAKVQKVWDILVQYTINQMDYLYYRIYVYASLVVHLLNHRIGFHRRPLISPCKFKAVANLQGASFLCA